MDNFFQKLRDIQKKERTTGNLTEIEDSFYTDASNYLQELLKMVDNNPLSLEAYQLRDAQRITTEICERREFKIVSTAATNVQKSHDIFKGHKSDSELYDVIPYNTTPEEEEFYKKLVDLMVDHRENLMDKIIPQKRSNETKVGFKPNKKRVVVEDIKKEEEQTPVKEEVPQKVINEDAQEEEKVVKKKSKPKGPVLDESQIAMMFGQAPDDVLVDENNNPVKAVKKDITTPFAPPKPPVEDTVSLQNETPKTDAPDENIPDKQDLSESVPTSTDVPTTTDVSTDINESPEDTQNTEESTGDINKDYQGELTDAGVNAEISDVELVEFKDEITTDILDENEKTYGPFESQDMVLLPKTLVKILLSRDVVRIIH